MDMLIAQFHKNAVEQIRIALRDYKGRRLIDMRTYYQDDAGEWLPTKKGIALTVEQWLELRAAPASLAQALEETPPEAA
jgi:transcriptional coactivator p15 (PC4)